MVSIGKNHARRQASTQPSSDWLFCVLATLIDLETGGGIFGGQSWVMKTSFTSWTYEVFHPEANNAKKPQPCMPGSKPPDSCHQLRVVATNPPLITGEYGDSSSYHHQSLMCFTMFSHLTVGKMQSYRNITESRSCSLRHLDEKIALRAWLHTFSNNTKSLNQKHRKIRQI